MVKRHMHTLKIQAMMIGLQVYHKILFLDVETIVCASLHSFFFTVDSQRSQVAFVPVSKGHFYGRDIVARVFDIPTNFPEAKAEIMVFKWRCDFGSNILTTHDAFRSCEMDQQHIDFWLTGI